jgi:hypothetical protein
LTDLQRDHAEKMPAVGVPGINRKDFATQGRRLLQLPRLVMADSALKAIGQRSFRLSHRQGAFPAGGHGEFPSRHHFRHIARRVRSK